MIADRNWIKLTVDHQETASVPYNFMFSPPAARIAKEYYGEDLEESLALPIRMTGPSSKKPLYADPDKFGETVADEFGVIWTTSKMDRGAPVGPCLTEPSLMGYAFPNPTQADRFLGLSGWCLRQQQHYRIIWVCDLWERATFMRGMEQILLDVVMHPKFVHALLEHLAEYALETLRTLIETCDFEGIAISDDYGMQNAMVMSPEHWRSLVKPYLSRIYQLAKKHGLVVFHHSCGNIVPIIGDMIDMGLDILHPIQPEAMDVLFLKKEFGKYLTLCGGIPTQTLLISATPADVRKEVRRLKRQMGAGGGYILEPGITIQADVPRDNMIAMIDEARTP